MSTPFPICAECAYAVAPFGDTANATGWCCERPSMITGVPKIGVACLKERISEASGACGIKGIWFKQKWLGTAGQSAVSAQEVVRFGGNPRPGYEVPVVIGYDNCCECGCETPCPLGRAGSSHRCTTVELMAHEPKLWLRFPKSP